MTAPQTVRIYRPSKTAMQSARGNEKDWVLEFVATPLFIEPLMGWTGSTDTRRQIKLYFPSQQAAIAYAEEHGFAYDLRPAKERKFKPKNYAANFAYNKVSG